MQELGKTTWAILTLQQRISKYAYYDSYSVSIHGFRKRELFCFMTSKLRHCYKNHENRNHYQIELSVQAMIQVADFNCSSNKIYLYTFS